VIGVQPVLVSGEALAEVPPGRRGRVPRFLRRPGGAFGAGWLILVLALSVTAPLWQPYPENAQDLSRILAGPSRAHWLGTDDLGRDILTRIFAAGGQSLLAAATTVAVAFAIALPLVFLAAERPRAERWTSRGAEVQLALPSLVILLAVIGAFGVRVYLVMALLGVLVAPAIYRVLLGLAQSLHQRLHVDAARVDGVGTVGLNARHVLPGMATVIAVQASQLFAVSILVQSGLAFMGFGPADPAPSWGGMIALASQYVYNDPWMMVPTGAVLAITVVAANLVADALAFPAGSRRRRRKSHTISPDAAGPPTAMHTSLGDTRAEPRPLLEASRLTVGLADGPSLVTDVNLALQEGHVLGLAGESGCGKTITALSLLGLLPDGVVATGGSLRWHGRELLSLSEREWVSLRGREIAMVPQDPMVALDPLFTIGYQLTTPIRRLRGLERREARQRAIEQLTRVGIHEPEHVMRLRAHEVSGGMAQRIAIALALSGTPRLIVADEPTTALDVTTQAEILDLLRSLVDEAGIAVLIVSHDLGVIADICDDVAIMYAGNIVEQGPTETVLEAPRHPYTMALLAADPHVPAGQPVPSRLAAIAGTVPAPGEWPAGCRFAARCRFALPGCEAPVALSTAPDGTRVRCVRSDEIRERGMRWEAAQDLADAAGVETGART
jgi:peptide/nickel transport system permease protein